MVYRRKKKLADKTVVEYPHYWYRFKRNGILIRVNTKQNNKRAAEDLESAHRTRLAKCEAGLRDGRDIPTLKQFEKRFTEAIEARCIAKPRTAKFYQQKMANLLAFQPLANARLDRIDEAIIEQFVQHRRKQVARPKAASQEDQKLIAPATVNRALATLRRALRLAQEWKILDRVPRFKMLPGERNREFVLSSEQEQVYLAACPQPLKDLATLVLDTGLRVGEALRLEWTDIHLDPINGSKLGSLQVRHGKSKNAKRVVSLTQRAVRLLKEKSRTMTDQFVFSNGGGKPYIDTSLAHLQEAVREKLNWSEEFVIHSLRHTMLTRLGEAGVDAFIIMRIAGHSSITVSQKYVHPTPESLERAFEKLEALNQPRKKSGGPLGAHRAAGRKRGYVQVIGSKR